MHVNHCATLLTFTRLRDITLRKTDLLGAIKVPTFILFVVVSIESLFAKIAEVICRNVGLRPIIGHNILLLSPVSTRRFT